MPGVGKYRGRSNHSHERRRKRETFEMGRKKGGIGPRIASQGGGSKRFAHPGIRKGGSRLHVAGSAGGIRQEKRELRPRRGHDREKRSGKGRRGGW